MSDLTLGVLDSLNRKMAGRAEPGDYIVDGLLYCGKCHTKKQCIIKIGDTTKIRWCLCKCQADDYEEKRNQERTRERQLYIESLRSQGIQDKDALRMSFKTAENSREISLCRKYAVMFDQMYRSGSGLLLWGNTGCGKTFAAACIANELIDHEVPVLMTSFPRILGAPFEERDEIIREMNKYRLLILDDFGAERRNSEYSMETIYRVIDARYKSGKPMILTTNLTLSQIKNPQSVELSRIYWRVLEVCAPVCFDGPNRREDGAKRKTANIKKILYGDVK